MALVYNNDSFRGKFWVKQPIKRVSVRGRVEDFYGSPSDAVCNSKKEAAVRFSRKAPPLQKISIDLTEFRSPAPRSRS